MSEQECLLYKLRSCAAFAVNNCPIGVLVKGMKVFVYNIPGIYTIAVVTVVNMVDNGLYEKFHSGIHDIGAYIVAGSVIVTAE